MTPRSPVARSRFANAGRDFSRLARLPARPRCALAFTAVAVPAVAQIDVAVDASKTGAKIDRQIFGQFAEHLGTGIYEGCGLGPARRSLTRAAFAPTSSLR